jgi:hypothetical protein
MGAALASALCSMIFQGASTAKPWMAFGPLFAGSENVRPWNVKAAWPMRLGKGNKMGTPLLAPWRGFSRN